MSGVRSPGPPELAVSSQDDFQRQILRHILAERSSADHLRGMASDRLLAFCCSRQGVALQGQTSALSVSGQQQNGGSLEKPCFCWPLMLTCPYNAWCKATLNPSSEDEGAFVVPQPTESDGRHDNRT